MVPLEPSLYLSRHCARTRDKSSTFILAAPGILHPAGKRGFAYTQRTAWYIQDVYINLLFGHRGHSRHVARARKPHACRMRRRRPAEVAVARITQTHTMSHSIFGAGSVYICDN